MEISETFTEDYTIYYGNDSLNYFSANDSLGSGNTTKATQSRDEDLAKIEIAVLALIFVFTVLGNFIVLMGIYFRRQKMSRMYYFILHLSIADLITAFFNVLTQLIWELTWHFQGGNFLCKFIKYAQILGPYSSSYVLIMTAVDRYQAICYPLSNCTWTARRSKLMLGFAWTLSVLLCIPQLFIFSYMEISPGVSDCWATFIEGWGAKAYVTWYAITVFIIPLIILTFAYTCICRAIWINFSMKNSIRRHQFSRSSRTSRDSETENELCHTIVDSDGQHGNGSQRLELLHKRASVNNSKAIPYYNNLKESEVSFGRNKEGISWRRDVTALERAGKTVTVTTSFMKSPDDNFNAGTNGPTPLTHYHNHHPDRERFSSFRDPDDSDEEIEMDETGPTSPQIDRIQIFPNGAKYSTPVTSDEHQTNRSKNKFNRNGSHSKSNNSKTKAARPSVWSSSKNTNCLNETTISGQSSVGGELTPKGNLKQLLLTPSRNLNNTHSIVAREEGRGKQNAVNSMNTRGPPRRSSVKGISRAKIKTIKLTVTVICCYVFCSSPFIAAQLWATYDPDASKSPFWTGATFTILTLLASLNSCVNPWIFLFFNPNLLQDFLKGFGCSNLIPQKSRGGHLPNAATVRKSASPAGAISRANTMRSTVSRVDGTQLKTMSISSSVNMNATPVEAVSSCLLSTDASRSVKNPLAVAQMSEIQSQNGNSSVISIPNTKLAG
ncbi:unnamed protein product [Allacma fusca]|uniref:G-protein coupled receptors family 1 profile domain-containing protein n=1 Tax=Allacma fusca TaxID=39272 RepID=A0A8J2J5G3_9HEXA|nr:unnamed protein product [Allacma fusca]